MKPLTETERDEALRDLSAAGWSAVPDRDAIVKEFRFGDFSQAMGWMMRAAIEAEKCDHHPEWSNIYNRVTVLLTTHDAGHETGALSTRDIELARALDQL